MFLTDVDKAELPHNVSRTLYIYIYIKSVLALKITNLAEKKKRKKPLKITTLLKTC